MKYIANPVEVDTFRITAVAVSDRGHVLTLDDGKEVIADEGMTARMTPKVGDYWVVQSDGYVYLNPREVFERKYTPVRGTVV
jgi:hypothetical protein